MLIKEKIEDNLFLFLEFLETKLETSNEFLSLILELKPSMEEKTFKKLFARVCAIHQSDELEIDKDMALQGLSFLTEQKR